MTYRQYNETFVAEAVALYERSNTSFNAVAARLGVPASNLTRWYDLAMVKKGKKTSRARPRGVPVTEAAPEAESADAKIARLERQVAVLQKQNADLQTDREILKKAAAFFAKESE